VDGRSVATRACRVDFSNLSTRRRRPRGDRVIPPRPRAAAAGERRPAARVALATRRPAATLGDGDPRRRSLRSNGAAPDSWVSSHQMTAHAGAIPPIHPAGSRADIVGQGRRDELDAPGDGVVNAKSSESPADVGRAVAGHGSTEPRGPAPRCATRIQRGERARGRCRRGASHSGSRVRAHHGQEAPVARSRDGGRGRARSARQPRDAINPEADVACVEDLLGEHRD
jgi:hypothetical protein